MDSRRDNSEVELSICIATRNRGDFIAETLHSIVGQLDHRIELVIVDGASTDSTREQVQYFSDSYPQVRYFCEECNSGVDRDFDKAINYAQGRYVWLMTDDDLLMPNAIDYVLASIEEGNDLIVVNAEVWNEDFSKNLNGSHFGLRETRTYTAMDSADFFRDAVQGLTFIGATVIRRAVWLSRDRKTYYGSLFIHVGVIFQSPPIAKIKLISTPLVKIRYGNAMWTPRSFEIWMYKWPLLVWSFSEYGESDRASITVLEPWRSAMRLFHFRAKNAYTRKEYTTHISTLPVSVYRILANLISIFPVFVANIFALLYLLLGRDSSPTLVYDIVHNQPIPRLRRWLARINNL